MYPPARDRRDQRRPITMFEIACVVVVFAAFVALAVWIVLNSGGGVLNQG